MNPHVRLNVEKESSLNTDDGRQKIQAAEGHAQANVGQQNVGSLAATEDGTVGVKVASTKDALGGLLHALVAGRGVEDEIHGPAKDLVEEQLQELVDRGILEVLHVEPSVLLLLLVVVAGLGHKSHVLFHVSGEHVMTVVGELPRKVRDHKTRMRKEAHDVVEARVLGESTVAGFVAQDPDASADQALDEAVDDPGNGADGGIGDHGDTLDRSVSQDTYHDVVTDDVAHGDEGGGLEAVLGDGISDRLDVWVDGLGNLDFGAASKMLA